MSFKDRFYTGTPRTASKAAAPFVMKRVGDNAAEIVLYGDIVSQKPTDWYGDPIDGQYIILSEFLEDLKQVEDVTDLTIRIHSAGGSAYDAMVIHNRLKSLPATVKVIVDGVAMSGGSLIMCAGDTVQVYPGSLIMIHKCWSFLFGGYNATELRRIADSDDAVDRSQAAIYQVKTGIDAEELLDMMEQETYMTGQEAVDKGFADELMEGAALDIAASADRSTLFVSAMPVWISARKDGIPAALKIPTVFPEADASVLTNIKQPAQTGSQNGGNTMANTLEELRQENPALAEQLMAEARAAAGPASPLAPTTVPVVQEPATDDPVAVERKRLQEIDEVAGLFDAETVSAAKYGEKACTAQEMAYRAAQKATKNGHAFLANLESDNKASGAQDVGAAASPGIEDAPRTEDLTPEQRMAAAKVDVQALLGTNKKEE